MRFRVRGLLLLFAVVGFATNAQAGLIGLDVRMQFPDGAPPLDVTTTVVDPGVEFSPYGQLQFDVADSGLVTFQPLTAGLFIDYDAIFTIVTPGFEFTGVSGLTPQAGYSVSFDAAAKSIIFHHDFGNDGPPTILTFQAESNALVPEPATLTLLGLGVTGAAARRQLRRVRGSRTV